MGEIRLRQIDYAEGPDGHYFMAGRPETLSGLQVPETVDYDELVKRFREGNDTYEVREDPSGRQHETVIFNADQMSNGLILKPSTSFSSAYKNPANMLETALAATLNPGAAYLYWGSFGNYPTGHLSREDRQHIRQSGRYTNGDGSAAAPYVAITGIRRMVDMLETEELMPTHIVADQEAGRLALGIMAALEPDTVKGVFLNGIEGVSKGASYEASSIIEDAKSRIRRRQIGQGKAGELTPVNIKDLKANMPAIYKGIGKVAHLAPLPVFLFPKDVRDKIGLTIGFRAHKDLTALDDHAVFQAMSAALRRQETRINMQFNKESSQHDLEDCVRFGQIVMDNIPAELRGPGRGVRLLIGDGTLTQSTDAPHESTRIQRHVFPDITHQMSALFGGKLIDAQVFDLAPVTEAA